MNPRGFFAVFEGGEGAGKGSVMSAVARWLEAQGINPLCTREPGGTAEGQLIRAALVQRGSDWDPLAELLLLMADRAQHVRKLIQPSIDAGRLVLCDRFFGSTVAYQGGGRELSIDLIRELQCLAVGNLRPDLNILLDVPPAIGLKRSLRRLNQEGSKEDLFERLDIEFHDRVRNCFLEQANQDPDHWISIDATQPVADVVIQVQEIFRKIIDGGLPFKLPGNSVTI